MILKKIDIVLILLFISMFAPAIAFVYGKDIYERYLINHKKFPNVWRNILLKKISFYKNLTPKEKIKFERDILVFFKDYQIKGVNFKVNDTDKLLVASSGIIPVFYLKPWYYPELKTIYLFEDSFTMHIPGYDGAVSLNGLVGQGAMKHKMYLSKKALHQSFKDDADHKNTALHEFLHLIDMDDGQADGLPKTLLPENEYNNWLDLVWKKIAEIKGAELDISDYASESPAEFFAETGVYFFENPKQLKQNHPELYHFFMKMFHPELQ